MRKSLGGIHSLQGGGCCGTAPISASDRAAEGSDLADIHFHAAAGADRCRRAAHEAHRGGSGHGSHVQCGKPHRGGGHQRRRGQRPRRLRTAGVLRQGRRGPRHGAEKQHGGVQPPAGRHCRRYPAAHGGGVHHRPVHTHRHADRLAAAGGARPLSPCADAVRGNGHRPL